MKMATDAGQWSSNELKLTKFAVKPCGISGHTSRASQRRHKRLLRSVSRFHSGLEQFIEPGCGGRLVLVCIVYVVLMLRIAIGAFHSEFLTWMFQ